MPKPLADHRLFFREFRRNFETTGAILPSGRQLVAALARPLDRAGQGRRILEVGPGTGAVTGRIVSKLRADDTLDLVEANAAFVEALQQRFAHDPTFRGLDTRARVRHVRVEEIVGDEPYDVIISGLPLNNFSVPQVEEILALFCGLAKPGGVISFFEYVAVRQARALVSSRPERRRLHGVGRTLRDWLRPREFARELILGNVPPAWVHHAHPLAATLQEPPASAGG